MVFFLVQGVVQVIEDGVCFVECLVCVCIVVDLLDLLCVYESIWKLCVERVQKGIWDLSYVWYLFDGLVQEERDWVFVVMVVVVCDEESDVVFDWVNLNSFSSKNFQLWLFGYDEIVWINVRLDELYWFVLEL